MIALYLAAVAASTQVQGAQAEGPKQFIAHVYAAYARENYSPLDRPATVFAPALVRAIREDARLAHGEVGFLDGDPLCGCQDYGKISVRVRTLKQPARQSANALVHVDLGIGEARDVRLKLVLTKSGWRIADVGSNDQPSLLRAIQASNRRERARH